MKGARLIVIVVGALLSGSLRAQENALAKGALTLEMALTEGLSRSPEVGRAQAAREEASWRHFEALGAGFLPKVSANAHHFFYEKYSLTNINFGGNLMIFPGFYPTNVAGFDISIPLFDGLANVRTLQAAALSEDASVAELEHAEFELRQNIRLAFFKALATYQLQSVAEQNVRTLEDHLKQVDVRKAGGAATRYDVLRVQVQLSEAQSDALDARDNYDTARKRLATLLGLENDDRIPSGQLPLPDASRVKGLKFAEVPKDRSDIRALNFRADAADRMRAARLSWLVPSVSLNGEYMYYDAQLFDVTVQDTGKYKSAYSLGLFLKWDLFDGGVSIARQREAAYQAVQAEKAAQSAKLQVPYDFEYWKHRYLSNTDHYNSKQLDVERSLESVRLAKEEERAGTRTSTETLDAELDLFRAKAGVVNALVNAAEAQIRLEEALGREI